jgi:hypothetical protein
MPIKPEHLDELLSRPGPSRNGPPPRLIAKVNARCWSSVSES